MVINPLNDFEEEEEDQGSDFDHSNMILEILVTKKVPLSPVS